MPAFTFFIGYMKSKFCTLYICMMTVIDFRVLCRYEPVTAAAESKRNKVIEKTN